MKNASTAAKHGKRLLMKLADDANLLSNFLHAPFIVAQTVRPIGQRLTEWQAIPQKSYPGIVVTFKDGVACGIELSFVDQLLPTNAPYVASVFGSREKAHDTIQPRIKSAVAKTFEPVTLSEARSRHAELEKDLFNLLTPDFQGAGLSLISVSLTDYVVLSKPK